MDESRVAEVKVLLEGVPLPAEKARLLEYAVQQRAEPPLLEALRQLADREYPSLDDVADELLHVQPDRRDGRVPHRPGEVSGAPPGGDAYTDRDPDPGRVRDLPGESG